MSGYCPDCGNTICICVKTNAEAPPSDVKEKGIPGHGSSTSRPPEPANDVTRVDENSYQLPAEAIFFDKRPPREFGLTFTGECDWRWTSEPTPECQYRLVERSALDQANATISQLKESEAQLKTEIERLKEELKHVGILLGSANEAGVQVSMERDQWKNLSAIAMRELMSLSPNSKSFEVTK